MLANADNDIGKLILRLSLGGLMLFHGVHKLLHFTGTMGWLTQVLAHYHLPAFVGYGVFVGEVIAPIIIILGFYTRIGGLIIVINMLFATLLAAHSELFHLTSSGGWAYQLDAFFLLTGLALIFLGGGRYGINRH